ncbi:MAG: YicC family protein [Bacteroidetes bacterium]|nr:YicC family protein [Bacteroidota bacterium]
MLYSMTGYGKSTLTLGNKNYIVEIKSLNSKSLDLNFKAVADLRGKEIDIRKQIGNKLLRGKIDLFFQEDKSNENASILNFNLIEKYYHQLQAFSKEKNIPFQDITSSILRFQDVNKPDVQEFNDSDFSELQISINDAMEKLMEYRKLEGEKLEADILQRINIIQSLKETIIPFEQQRIVKIREKIKQEISTLISSDNIDNNRLEEELIYYIEKLDINEEKVRLSSHCQYFLEILQESSLEKGKKLGFIVQEIGREINTIGSKANDANIQKIVVQMKDEVEKIKEQLMNIL